jgi:hypothetical protein
MVLLTQRSVADIRDMLSAVKKKIHQQITIYYRVESAARYSTWPRAALLDSATAHWPYLWFLTVVSAGQGDGRGRWSCLCSSQ